MVRDGFFLMWRSSVGSHSHVSCNWVCQGSVLRWPGRDTDISRTFLARQAVSIAVIVGSLLSTYINICTQVWMCNHACVCAGVCIPGGHVSAKTPIHGLKITSKEKRGCQLLARNSAAGRHSPPGKAFCQNNWESCKDNFPMEPTRMLGQRDKRHAS